MATIFLQMFCFNYTSVQGFPEYTFFFEAVNWLRYGDLEAHSIALNPQGIVQEV